ncbi:ANTAR domain-containing protein [Streptomyces cyaneofuscatus]|uniref:ANTAR domain-containing protein n=1 Tax=Streptomyces cyaneofuscatus TaxID=66883 RepID=UPI00364EAC1D
MRPFIESEEDHERNAAAGGPESAEHEMRRLRREVEELRRALQTRPMIDVALGMVMATEGCSLDQAWRVLVNSSQRTNTKLRILAQRLTESSANSLSPEDDTTAPDLVILHDAPDGPNPQKR